MAWIFLPFSLIHTLHTFYKYFDYILHSPVMLISVRMQGAVAIKIRYTKYSIYYKVNPAIPCVHFLSATAPWFAGQMDM